MATDSMGYVHRGKLAGGFEHWRQQEVWSYLILKCQTLFVNWKMPFNMAVLSSFR